MTDEALQQHVFTALGWEPSIDAADLRVTVHDGVVTLRGTVKSYAEKVTAERVSLRVFGVKAVADELSVQLPHGQRHTDSDIASAALSALAWNTVVPSERVTISVRDGWITLAGSVDWNYQRSAALDAVRELRGVRGVTNAITVERRPSVPDVKEKIEAALTRSAEVDARRINVAVADGQVILSGTVHSWFERDEARQAAWAAPGVTQVVDRIAVVP